MNSTISIIGAGALMAASAILSGCSQSADAQNGLTLTGSKYCSAFKASSDTTSTAALNAALSDPAGAFDDCVHRWGYTLAPARDPAYVVAQAAVDACGPILSAWSQQAGQPQNAPSPRYDRRGAEQQTQQPSPEQQQMRQAESKALFYVVQARAAGCQPPPANTLLAANNNGG
jgi:hypothetical protein